MKYVKKFESFIKEATITASPQPAVKPGVANPDIAPPPTV